MSRPLFELESRDGEARAGVLHTRRGEVPTPAFMPVATQGTVKAVTHEEVEALGFRLVIANAYHLAVRPGAEVIGRAGGLHAWMGWPHAIATDSGGFQVMSLAKFRTISDAGVDFSSPLDGVRRTFTPESVMALQETYGSDFAMCLDECPPAGADEGAVEAAVVRTTAWARRALAARRSGTGALFGIVQGGTIRAQRERSAAELGALGFDAYAIGGLSVGEPKPDTLAALGFTAPLLPPAKPRYLMGVGEPGDVLEAVAAGVDLFDCVFPTRVARNGLALTWGGRVVVRNAAAGADDGPLDAACPCLACRRHSRAYLRHLVHANEITGHRLLTLHNLTFMRDLMAGIRAAVVAGTYDAFLRRHLPVWRASASQAGETVEASR